MHSSLLQIVFFLFIVDQVVFPPWKHMRNNAPSWFWCTSYTLQSINRSKWFFLLPCRFYVDSEKLLVPRKAKKNYNLCQANAPTSPRILRVHLHLPAIDFWHIFRTFYTLPHRMVNTRTTTTTTDARKKQCKYHSNSSVSIVSFIEKQINNQCCGSTFIATVSSFVRVICVILVLLFAVSLLPYCCWLALLHNEIWEVPFVT